MTVFDTEITRADGTKLTRSIKAESAEKALQLMRVKFEDAADVRVVGHREQSVTELAEEARIRASADHLEERIVVARRKRSLRGAMMAAIGLAGPLIIRLVGHPYLLLDVVFVVVFVLGLLLVWSSRFVKDKPKSRFQR